MPSPKFCPSCGQPVPPGAPTCPNCGQPFETSSMNQPQTGFQQQPIYPQPPKQKNPLVLVCIILAGLLIAGLIAAVIYFATAKEEKAEVGEIDTPSTVELATADTSLIVTEPSATTPQSVATPETVEQPAEPKRPRRSSPYDYVVDGSVGKYGIQMEISLQGGGNITGRYRYTRMKGVGGWLQLHGSHYSNSFDMYETNKYGEVTGTFSGTYSINGDQLKLSGSMTNAKGTTYRFNAKGYESN